MENVWVAILISTSGVHIHTHTHMSTHAQTQTCAHIYHIHTRQPLNLHAWMPFKNVCYQSGVFQLHGHYLNLKIRHCVETKERRPIYTKRQKIEIYLALDLKVVWWHSIAWENIIQWLNIYTGCGKISALSTPLFSTSLAWPFLLSLVVKVPLGVKKFNPVGEKEVRLEASVVI